MNGSKAGNGQRQRVVLTGASRGIGHATVKRFSDAGWEILPCSRDEVPAECRRDPHWPPHIPADLAAPEAVVRFLPTDKSLLAAGTDHPPGNHRKTRGPGQRD